MKQPGMNGGALSVRPYGPDDREECLAIFDSNVSRFFDPSEREEFARFLDGYIASSVYLVIERDDTIMGCGGFAFQPDGVSAILCWAMVAREDHGQGLGRELLKVRLNAIRRKGGLMRVEVHTSQHTEGFYLLHGFVTEKITKNGYGDGLNRHDMVMTLSP